VIVPCSRRRPGTCHAPPAARRHSAAHVAPAPIIYGESLGLPPEDEIADVASAWLKQTALGIDCADSDLLSGHAGSAACAWANQAGVDLLVAGAHRGWLARLALRSFAGYVAYHAPCPVLLVRPDTP
jgi:nucleotide-binding universal stress UspA family protein